MSNIYKTSDLLDLADKYEGYDKPISVRPHFKNLTTNHICTFVQITSSISSDITKGLGEDNFVQCGEFRNDNWKLLKYTLYDFMDALLSGKRIKPSAGNYVFDTPLAWLGTLSELDLETMKKLVTGTWVEEE